MMNDDQKKLFTFGALAYPAMELLWRKRTHPTMALVGGSAMLLLNAVEKKLRIRGVRYIAGALGLTALELAFGLIFNKKNKIWDYSNRKGNFAGQICPTFALAWLLLCLPGYAICKRFRVSRSSRRLH